MVDPYAIVRCLTGYELISPKDARLLTEAVDGLIGELGSKDARIAELEAEVERLTKEAESYRDIALTSSKPEQVPSGWKLVPEEPEAWRPIETAPKDGTQFQAWIEKYGWEPHARFNPDSEAFELWGRVDYDKDAWDVYPHMVPTHWMPLPTPPTAGGDDE